MRHCGLRMADCGWRPGRTPCRSQSLSHSVTQLLAPLAVFLLIAPAAFGDAIAVTASLDVTDGLARVGYYVPVTLKATNRSDRAAREVLVSTGGPVDTRAAWFLAAGDSGETVVPVFYVGGDLALEVVFRDKEGGEIARLRPEPPEVHPVPDDTALVWLSTNAWEPDEEELEAVRRALEAGRLRIFRKGSLGASPARRCQLADAFPFPVPDSGGQYDLVAGPSLPSRIRTAVKPGAYALLSAGGSPGADPAGVWWWLVILAGLVLVVCVAVPRRRTVWAAVAMGGLGLAASAGVWLAQ